MANTILLWSDSLLRIKLSKIKSFLENRAQARFNRLGLKRYGNFKIFDVTKQRWRIGENAKYLDGKRDLIDTGEAGFTKSSGAVSKHI